MINYRKICRRTAALLLLLLLAASPLGGCRQPGNGAETTAETTASPRADIALTDKESSSPVYRLRYPLDGMNAGIAAAVADISGALDDIEINFNTAYDASLPEIITGDCACPATDAAKAHLPDGEHGFTVTAGDGKIVIYATCDALYGAAAAYFIANITERDGVMYYTGEAKHTESGMTALTLDGAGCRIIYPAASAAARTTAEKLAAGIGKLTGTAPAVAADTGSAAAGEILVGPTNRALSSDAAADLDWGEYRILLSPDGTVALGGDGGDAADMFLSMLTRGTDGSVILLSPAVGSHTVPGSCRAPAWQGDGVQTEYNRYGSFTVCAPCADAAQYEAYLALLASRGYTEYAKNSIGANLFATYYNNESIVNAYYTPDDGLVRIGVDSAAVSALPAPAAEHTPVTTVKLTSNHVESYIIRLEDGKFIVIDGGFNNSACIDLVYNTLTSQNVLGGKPVIAAWFLSHAHVDHVECFFGFAAKHASDVTVETVIMNNPGYATLSASKEDNGTCADAMLARIEKVEAALPLYTGAKLIIAHSGQKYRYAGAEIEMLMTQEDLFPEPMTVTNASTLVFTLKFNFGQKIMFFNDAYTTTCRTMSSRYAEALKCDIVQVAHHGYNGSLTSTYRYVAADYALWTNSYDTVIAENLFNNQAGQAWVCRNVRENLIVSLAQGSMTVDLPYTAGAAVGYIYKVQ